MLVTEWGFLDSLWRAVTGEDGPSVPGVALAGDERKHRLLYLEMDAVLDTDLPGRPHGDSAGIYEAAEVDGATGFRRWST